MKLDVKGIFYIKNKILSKYVNKKVEKVYIKVLTNDKKVIKIKCVRVFFE